MTGRAERVFAAVLAALALGFLTSPFVYIATGALFQFSPTFSLIALPPLLLGTALLGRRYLAKPADRYQRRVLWFVLEGAAWIISGAFLFFVSSANLMGGFERVGAVSTMLLLGAAVWFPVVFVRRTAIEQRLTRLPKTLAILAVVVVVGAAGAAAVVHLVTPPAFVH